MRFAWLGSLVLHVVAGIVLILPHLGDKTPNSAYNLGNKNSLQVKTLTQAEFEKKLAKVLDGDKTRQQIVQSDDQLMSDPVTAQAHEKTEKVFLSKHDQMVDRNTRARRVGKFKNVLKEGVLDPTAKASAKKVSAKSLFDLVPNPKDLEQKNAQTAKTGRLHNFVAREPASQSGPAGDGQSATDDFLEDIAIGANTLLNTKEFKFYSFYERVREKLSFQWHSRLDQEVQTLLGSGQNISGDQRTQVEIHLDKRGQILSLKVLSSSGFTELDRAATQAFYMSQPFPNPPTAMMNANNEVALSWDFVVVAEDTSGVHLDVRRSGF